MRNNIEQDLHKLVRLLHTKFEYFKGRCDTLASQCEDLEAKYQAESGMKKYLLVKARELEGMYMSTSTEIIQHRKEVAVSLYETTIITNISRQITKKKGEELAETKEKLDKENQTLKKIISKKVKSLEKKLEQSKTNSEKLKGIFQELYEFFEAEVKDK